jgi:hydroxyethylthiazole kinase
MNADFSISPLNLASVAEHSTAIAQDLATLRQQAPLILNLTNLVVMQVTANALLAVGASPIMSVAQEELADLMRIAKSLVINIGTLNQTTIETMETAMQLAQQQGIPCILDPVGAGASSLRTDTARHLCTLKPAVIRGNASEIMALAGITQPTKGVDSMQDSLAATSAAQSLAKEYQCTVVVSGAKDIIVTDRQLIFINNGHPLMQRATGTGCTATALLGAFCAIQPSFQQAAIAAMAIMGIAGELAAEQASGPGSWGIQFLDQLYHLNEQHLKHYLRLTIT